MCRPTVSHSLAPSCACKPCCWAMRSSCRVMEGTGTRDLPGMGQVARHRDRQADRQAGGGGVDRGEEPLPVEGALALVVGRAGLEGLVEVDACVGTQH